MTDDAIVIKENDVAVVGGPGAMIIQMLEHGLDTGKIEKMLELQERWEANEARKAFYDGMSHAQAEMPTVAEDKFNDQTKSRYSSYKALAAACKPVYTRHGLSLIFYETDCPKDGHIRVNVDVVHRMGHKETYHTDIPDDVTGIAGKRNKTDTHGKGSSFSYGRAYLMKLVFNLPTGDDDDGNAAGSQPVELISEENAAHLLELGEVAPGGLVQFKSWLKKAYKVDNAHDLPADKYETIKITLEGAIRKAS